MESSKLESSKVDKKIKLEVNWEYVKEASPSFKRLIMRLLKPVDNQSAETIQAVEEQQNE